MPSQARLGLRWTLLPLLLLAAAPAFAQGLPGLSGAVEPAVDPGFLTRVYGWLLMQQAELHRALIGLMRQLQEGAPGALFALIGGAFLYGVFHALGPGHGKLIISSYAFASGSAIRSSLLLTLVSSLAQAVSAVLLVGGLVLLLGQARLTATRNVHWLELASYALILLLGLAMLVRALMGKTGCCGHSHAETAEQGHDHHHHHDHGHGHGANRIPQRDFWAMVLSIGIRPCSGAVIVLLFTLGQGLFLAGVTATLAMAMGTALAVGGLALVAILARRGAFTLVTPEGLWGQRLGRGLAVVGSLAVVSLGSMMLWAAWQMPPTY
ncbi:MAG: hypothetical protein Kilf2KO_21530 [Rhodospirillales bacterium]